MIIQYDDADYYGNDDELRARLIKLAEDARKVMNQAQPPTFVSFENQDLAQLATMLGVSIQLNGHTLVIKRTTYIADEELATPGTGEIKLVVPSNSAELSMLIDLLKVLRAYTELNFSSIVQHSN